MIYGVAQIHRVTLDVLVSNFNPNGIGNTSMTRLDKDDQKKAITTETGVESGVLVDAEFNYDNYVKRVE